MSSSKSIQDHKPKVSVIIPTYNRGCALLTTVQSALGQTYDNIEIIIVDDCSHDDTHVVANSIVDSRVTVIRHERNQGVSGATNTGIRAATGELIAILEHDDIWYPDKLALQVPLMLKNPQVGLVYCNANLIDETGNIVQQWKAMKRGNVYRDFLLRNIVLTCSMVLVRKKCFDELGLFDSRLDGHQDGDMWIRIARHYKFDFVDQELVGFAWYPRTHLGTATRIAKTYDIFIENLAKYDYPSSTFRRRVMAFRYYEYANGCATTGEVGRSTRLFFRSLTYWPFSLRVWIFFMASLTGNGGYRVFEVLRDKAVLWRSSLRQMRFG